MLVSTPSRDMPSAVACGTFERRTKFLALTTWLAVNWFSMENHISRTIPHRYTCSSYKLHQSQPSMLFYAAQRYKRFFLCCSILSVLASAVPCLGRRGSTLRTLGRYGFGFSVGLLIDDRIWRVTPVIRGWSHQEAPSVLPVHGACQSFGSMALIRKTPQESHFDSRPYHWP